MVRAGRLFLSKRPPSWRVRRCNAWCLQAWVYFFRGWASEICFVIHSFPISAYQSGGRWEGGRGRKRGRDPVIVIESVTLWPKSKAANTELLAAFAEAPGVPDSFLPP